MTVELNEGIGHSTIEEGQDLDAFEFDGDDRFVRADTDDGDVWAVMSRSFKYTVSWVRERDNVPTAEEHRRYKLISRETFDEVEVSETELKRGYWERVDDADLGGKHESPRE